MGNRIIKKENGKITEGVREKISDIPYIENDENCFKNEINQTNFENYDLEKVQLLNQQMDKIFERMIVLDNENITNIYSMVKSVRNSKDLEKIYKTFLVKYAEILENKYNLSIRKSQKIKNIIAYTKEQIEPNFDIVISTIIKKAIENYYLLKLQKLPKEEINKLEDLRLNRISVDYIFQNLKESFDEQAKKNGVKTLSTKILLNTIDKLYERRQKHLCWENCKNALPNRCKKIDDFRKKHIRDYDFILDGYQILDKNGEVDTFVVSKCSNYELQKPKKLSRDEAKRIRKLKENIFMEYFEAGSVKEAKNIRDYMVKTKQIKE